jgi:hydroxymethylpyrimidine/phosphomethylpyrimidine kinase
MPVPEVQSLDKNSGDAQAKAALSSCIATEVNAGRDQKQATAMCYSMVERAIGRTLVSSQTPIGEG